jgi:hypothetical protein
MALFRIYPEKDSTIWSEPTSAGLYGNAGLDEILNIEGYPDSDLIGRSSRVLIQFQTSDIQSTLNSKVSNKPYSASLNLVLANASEIPTSFELHALPISSSWTQGIGKKSDIPVNRTGCTWEHKDAGTTSWDTLGGDTLSGYTVSQSFNVNSTLDVILNVTDIVDAQFSSSISNNGLLIKLEDSYEDFTSSSIKLSYFGSDTHTIFPPYLEFTWDDSIYSSTLDTIDTDILTTSIKNNKEKYADSDIVRFRMSARPKFPTRTFTTSSIYKTEYKLPENSYYGIQDNYSKEMIVDFDTVGTKVSADNTSSYFDFYMDTLQPERFYKVLIKTTIDSNTLILDDNNVFKVVKHG